MGCRALELFPAAIVLLIASLSFAQISPGPLSRGHSTLEGLNNCTRCHELGKEITNAKCLTCHTSIERRVSDGKGFHASAEVKGMKCAVCHSEHHGLEFELIHWPDGSSAFEHVKTGWPLTGAHRKLDCRACHKPDFIGEGAALSSAKVNLGRTYLGLSSNCLSCHQDEHREQLTNDCGSCHSTEAWSPAPLFSHAKSRYSLTGKHMQVACSKCHVSEDAPQFDSATLVDKKQNIGKLVRYSGIDFANCNSCHSDPHAGKLGVNCAACHSTDGFNEIVKSAFDHSKTDFPLAGRHASLQCQSCHKSERKTAQLSHAHCVDCHKDPHRSQLADRTDKGACESCHTVEGFTPARFTVEDHSKSKYPLTGAHLAVPCFACHQALGESKVKEAWNFEIADQSCSGCHKDIHDNQTAKWSIGAGCAYCHVTESWSRVAFNHDTTGYKLVGSHSTLLCSKCHLKDTSLEQVVRRFTGLKQDCSSCHKDPHAGQFLRTQLGEVVTQCQRCHTPEKWKQLIFDHNRDSQFVLEGAHFRATCDRCHSKSSQAVDAYIVYRPIAHECTSCHAARTPSSP